MAEPVDFLFGLWTPVGQTKHGSNRICPMAAMCAYERTHWCHMVNTIEPSVCSSDAALCQITLTSCYRNVTVEILLLDTCLYYGV